MHAASKGDQVWINEWLAAKTAAQQSQQGNPTRWTCNSSDKQSTAVVIEETKQELDRLIECIEHCRNDTNEQNSIEHKLQQANTLKRHITKLLGQLEESKKISQHRMSLKLAKQKRKKAWQKRMRTRQRKSIKDAEERRKQMLYEIDQWRIQQYNNSNDSNNQSRDTTKELCSMRKRAGQVFPEDDRAFYDQVEAMNNPSNIVAVPSVEVESMLIASKLDGNTDIYQLFYNQATQSLASLVAIRRGWDQYIVEPGSSVRASQVPPYWVMAPPPTNRKWAACLRQSAYLPTKSNTVNK
ncbi:hypothetical protein BDF19DRAFT_441043 [Syncephalis fuscata]|nr:hypothetical protein BDF19DRAFT_441043 [Syncephalis fuscata]